MDIGLRKRDPAGRLRKSKTYRKAFAVVRSSSEIVKTIDGLCIDDRLTFYQFSILFVLNMHGRGLSLMELSDELPHRAPDSSRLVQRLADKGMVIKTHGLEDARIVNITLSPVGKETINRLIPAVEEAIGLLL